MNGRWAKKRFGSDDGFTILELMVALTILAVGIGGVMGVMTGSFGVAGAGRSRSRAVAVATQEIEALRAKPYDQLVVSDGVTQYDVVVGAGTYHVQRAVSWADDATITSAYKSVTVQVSWSDEKGFHEVHQSSLIYPGGLGPHVAGVTPTTVPSGNPAAPTVLVAVAVPAVGGVDLAWTPPLLSPPPVDSYVVQYSTDSTFATYQEVTAAVPAVTPLVRITDLAPSTTYHFRVASRAANGNLSATWGYAYNVQTSSSSSTSCALGTATVTPSAVKKKNSSAGSGLTTNPVVNISLIGACSSTVLHMVYAPLGNGVTESVTLAGSGAIRTGQVGNDSQTWTVGDHDIAVLDGTNAQRATIRLVVCDRSKQTCP